jgi:2,5-diketo-D-gluconate reductase B
MSVTEIGPAKIPSLGLGTYGIGSGTASIVAAALSQGYRHVDTAQAYGNEEEVGRGIRDSGVSRDRVFLTTKIMPDRHEPEEFRTAAHESLCRLGTDYVDLLLLHWPSRTVPLGDTLFVLDELIEAGLVRHGGVSNFTIALLDEAKTAMRHPVAANQVEYHPYISQPKLVAAMDDRGIPLEAYAPIARGKVTEDGTLREIAEAHGATPVQVSLAWILAKGGIAIPKTGNVDRLPDNLQAAEIDLTDDEVSRIDGLSRPDGRLVSPEEVAPDWDD